MSNPLEIHKEVDELGRCLESGLEMVLHTLGESKTIKVVEITQMLCEM